MEIIRNAYEGKDEGPMLWEVNKFVYRLNRDDKYVKEKRIQLIPKNAFYNSRIFLYISEKGVEYFPKISTLKARYEGEEEDCEIYTLRCLPGKFLTKRFMKYVEKFTMTQKYVGPPAPEARIIINPIHLHNKW